MKLSMEFGKIRLFAFLQMAVVSILGMGCEMDMDEGSSSKNKQMVAATISASMSNNSSLRSGVVYGNLDIDSGEQFIWHENDKIGVFAVDEDNSIVFVKNVTPDHGYEFNISNYYNEEASFHADFVGSIPSDIPNMKRVLATSGLQYSEYTSNATQPYFYIKHNNPMQIGKSTSHLSEMDFKYSVSEPIAASSLESTPVTLPELHMKHINSLLRYHVMNETQDDWRVMSVEVSAVDAESGLPSSKFYSDCYIKIDIPNNMMGDKSFASVRDKVSLWLSESETDENGMKMPAGESIDGYQMVIPTGSLSNVNLVFTVVLSSYDGKSIKTCTPLVLHGKDILHERFESGYRYEFGLKITDELLSSL